MTPDVRRARTAFLWVGVIVPLAVIALATAIVVAWLPQIPDPSATHWSGGHPDDFGPPWVHPILLAGAGGGVVALFATITLVAHRVTRGTDAARPQWSGTARLLGASALGLSVYLSFLTLAAVGIQRGLDDAADPASITPWALGGLALLVGVTVLGWFLQPKAAGVPRETAGDAIPLALRDGERAVWVGTVAMARSGVIVLGVSLFVLALATVFSFAAGGEAGWITAIVLILVAVLVATMLVFRVRITADGLLVRSAVGWPRTRIPAGEVASVRATEIDPFAEFGGWGWRYALDGRRGVVLRKGEALEVTRRNGTVFVVTVDDAATAASVLATAVKKGEPTE